MQEFLVPRLLRAKLLVTLSGTDRYKCFITQIPRLSFSLEHILPTVALSNLAMRMPQYFVCAEVLICMNFS